MTGPRPGSMSETVEADSDKRFVLDPARQGAPYRVLEQPHGARGMALTVATAGTVELAERVRDALRFRHEVDELLESDEGLSIKALAELLKSYTEEGQ